jgi:hypothetical protein
MKTAGYDNATDGKMLHNINDKQPLSDAAGI